MTTHPSQAPGDRPFGDIRAARSAAVGRRAMIATSQSLASAEGLRVLQNGGNAIDAAVTAAAVLAVIEPSMNGIGGDLFALVHDGRTGTVHALDACGPAAARATPEEFARRGLATMPDTGVVTVTVPGVVSGWDALLSRFGTIPLARALEPAVGYALDGFPVAELTALEWRTSVEKLSRDAAAARTFLPAGRAPTPGECFANPRLAKSLALIAEHGRDAFYTGPIAQAIAADLHARGGLLTVQDLAEHTVEWVEPIATAYRGCLLLEMPPSNQGFVALEMLNILEGYDLASMGHNQVDYLHVMAEAKKIAFADRAAYLADRRFVPQDLLARLISKDYAAARRADIDMGRARDHGAATIAGSAAAGADFGGRDRGDTIYLTAADGQGNVVSFIQSLFASFGAGIVAGDTGIALHNRGSGFVLTPGHPNQVGPRKRPLHTLVPAMLLKGGRPWVSFGVMGGDNQAQAHAQIVTKLVDFGLTIQTAGDSARMRHLGHALALESGIGPEVRASLEARGHAIVDGRGQMGGYQGIMIDPGTGVFLGASDLRKDGLAIGW